jgi:hypothetical protein
MSNGVETSLNFLSERAEDSFRRWNKATARHAASLGMTKPVERWMLSLQRWTFFFE